ncbi:MAG: tryptophan synthase subunit alpha, partial [Ferruginibacter sp.]
MNNKLIQLFQTENKNLLNIYCTAGFPKKESTIEVILSLQKNGVDMVEVGMPYSDPIADGDVIQASNMVALNNGMTIELLFKQLNSAIKKIKVPIILMGYLNPVLQYGIEKFCTHAATAGVSGIILPDLPMYEYENLYKKYFLQNNLSFINLITPQTSTKRILEADNQSTGFIYAVSSSTTTGSTNLGENKKEYFEKISSLKLKNNLMIGFGISNKKTFNNAC